MGKAEEGAKDAIVGLLMSLEYRITENKALRLMLAKRGVSQPQIQRELHALAGNPVIKRRARAAFVPLRKMVLGHCRYMRNAEFLERVQISGKPH